MRGEHADTVSCLRGFEAGSNLAQDRVDDEAGVGTIARNMQRGLALEHAKNMPADVTVCLRRPRLCTPCVTDGAAVVDGEVDRLRLPPAAEGVRVARGADGCAHHRTRDRGGQVLVKEVREGGGSGRGVAVRVERARDGVTVSECNTVEGKDIKGGDEGRGSSAIGGRVREHEARGVWGSARPGAEEEEGVNRVTTHEAVRADGVGVSLLVLSLLVAVSEPCSSPNLYFGGSSAVHVCMSGCEGTDTGLDQATIGTNRVASRDTQKVVGMIVISNKAHAAASYTDVREGRRERARYQLVEGEMWLASAQGGSMLKGTVE